MAGKIPAETSHVENCHAGFPELAKKFEVTPLRQRARGGHPSSSAIGAHHSVAGKLSSMRHIDAKLIAPAKLAPGAA
jgi:hypothetical protein